MLCPPGTSASVDHFDVIFLQSLGHAHDAKMSKHLGVLLCLISRCLLVVDCYEVRLQQAGDVLTANPECQTLHCFGL